uniref:Uncharacterized protein n=1 Tax=Romanomermis culicivorax TaxID=13658 RepID=A0A915HJ63_ROMCU
MTMSDSRISTSVWGDMVGVQSMTEASMCKIRHPCRKYDRSFNVPMSRGEFSEKHDKAIEQYQISRKLYFKNIS